MTSTSTSCANRRHGSSRITRGASSILQIDDAASGDNAYPYQVTARLERLDPAHEGQIETVKARYVVGCDGARSTVRKSIGRALHGDSANHAWGVMDVLAVTDFPDVRFKCLIQSANDGSMIIIPREGGYLFRLYIELDKLGAGERVSDRNITADDLIAAARRILKPHALDVKEVAWWSVYEIGQRLCDKFDDVPEEDAAQRLPRVFIAGDACHTHSPKAGQGMNVSMQDGFNLGWKLASVLRKRSAPHLLHTYSAERQAVAKELIDFDREWAALLASSKGFDAAETQKYFVRHGRYTAGTATRYRPALLTGEPTYQHLAEGLTIGMRFHSAPVIRVADAKPVHLGHAVKADGRWRIFAFAGAENPAAPNSGIRALCDFLGEAPRVSGEEIHPGGRGHRRGDRCPCGFPARPSGTRHRIHAVLPSAAEGTLRTARLREDVLPRPEKRPRHLHHARHRSRAGLHGGRAAGPIRRARSPARRLCAARGVLRWLHDAAECATARLIACRSERIRRVHVSLIGSGTRNARLMRDDYAAFSRTVSGTGSGLLAEPSINSTVMKIMSWSPRFSRSCTLNSPAP